MTTPDKAASARSKSNSVGDFKSLSCYWYKEDDVLGKGAYGAVLKAYDERTASPRGANSKSKDDGLPTFIRGAKQVALKRMANTNLEDGVSASTFREIMVLRELAYRLRSDQRPSCVLRCGGESNFLPTDAVLSQMKDDGINAEKIRRNPDRWNTTFAAVSDEDEDEEEVSVVEMKRTPSTPADNLNAVSANKNLQNAILKGREHLIELYEVIVDRESNAVFAALEYCDGGDMWHFLKEVPNRRIENVELFRRWMRELLEGIAFMHDRHITHRDLKPQNLMLKTMEGVKPGTTGGEQYCIKIGDFGLSRIEDIPVKKYVHEAITLWYRSPDVLLGNTNFSFTADVWSIGCIIAEVASGSALFRGRDPEDQLKRIFARIGVPNAECFPEMHNYAYSDDFDELFEAMQSYATEERNRGLHIEETAKELKLLKESNTAPYNRRYSPAILSHLAGIKARLRACFSQRGNFEVLGDDGLDLIARLLIYSPKERMTVQEALNHPYLKIEQEFPASPEPPASFTAKRLTSPATQGAAAGSSNGNAAQVVPKPPNNKSAPSSNKSSVVGLLPQISSTTASAEIVVKVPTNARKNIVSNSTPSAVGKKT